MLKYAPGGSFQRLRKASGGLGEKLSLYFIDQLVEIFYYLHNVKNFCHRDLKHGNLLVDQDLKLILTDFGFAAFENVH